MLRIYSYNHYVAENSIAFTIFFDCWQPLSGNLIKTFSLLWLCLVSL